MIYCPSCGKSIPADSKFCTFCGALVPTVEVNKTVEPERVVPVVETRTVTREVVDDGRPLYTPANFFSSPGFWGSILVIGGFFLPWLRDDSAATGLQLVRNNYEPWKLVLLLFPLSAFIVLIQSLTGALPAGLSGFFKFVPFLVLIGFVALMTLGSSDDGTSKKYVLDFHDIPALIKTIGIGLWITIVGALFMLFHKKYTRIR
jgi:endogenous inhibitor of DNA gyrase (YacG/DUF329 family)